jgi:hypothetical protein
MARVAISRKRAFPGERLGFDAGALAGFAGALFRRLFGSEGHDQLIGVIVVARHI